MQKALTADPVPADDRAFLYGDGLFETLLAVDGCPAWPELHLDRLAEGARRLAMDVSRDRLREEMQALLDEAPQRGAAVLRLTLSRGSGDRGYTPPQAPRLRFVGAWAPLASDPLAEGDPLTVGLSAVTLAEQPLLAGIKHCNRLEQVLAAAEARQRGLDDVLMATADGCLHCSSNANILVLRDRQLLTPPCDRAGIRGTRRRLVMEQLAPRLGLSVTECALTPDALYASDAVLLCNSVRGFRRVQRFEQHEFPPLSLADQLGRAYREALRQCIAS